jgi:hypothetical protein
MRQVVTLMSLLLRSVGVGSIQPTTRRPDWQRFETAPTPQGAGDLGHLTISAIQQTGKNLAVVIVAGSDLSDSDLTSRLIDAK